MKSLNLHGHTLRYQALFGVGGIGSGMFFRLNGDHTLGREESRSGFVLDRKDYCKLHIIAHYVKALLGPDFRVIPIGKVGADDVGTRLVQEMRETGLEMQYVEQSPGAQTLFSFCFIYPDGSGGNLTTSDSACSSVDPAMIAKAEPDFARFAGKGIALAAPEVPLAAREALLAAAGRHRFLRVASFTSEEMQTAVASGLIACVDLLAVNLDEAAAAAGMKPDACDPLAIVQKAMSVLCTINPRLLLSVTHGKNGSWCWDGSAFTHVPACRVHVESTAGAGDAHLAGLIAGLTLGLPLCDAQQLAALTGGASVMSPHTINRELDRDALSALAVQRQNELSNDLITLLEKDS